MTTSGSNSMYELLQREVQASRRAIAESQLIIGKLTTEVDMLHQLVVQQRRTIAELETRLRQMQSCAEREAPHRNPG